MKIQYYFEDENSEICYTKKHFEIKMYEEDITEIEVFKAIPDKIKGIFWCKHYGFCGQTSESFCGKQCDNYAPRNGKSGCCKRYTTRIYLWGEKITLKLKP